ncbi:MAG: RidA family protein [Pirellulales bacterium]
MTDFKQVHPRRTFLGRLATGCAAGSWPALLGRSPAADNFPASNSVKRCIEGNLQTGAAKAVVVGDVPLIHTEQVFAKREGSDGDRSVVIAAVEQALERRLSTIGSSLDDAVRLHFYVASDTWVSLIEDRLAKRFSGGFQPAVTFVTGNLAEAGALVAADCVAVSREAVDLGQVGRFDGGAILPPGDKLYVSGDAKPGDITMATRETLKSLENTLRFAKLDWSHVVQLKTFLQPIDQAGAVRAAMLEFLGDRKLPPLVFVEWRSPSLPLEIELIATVPPEHGNRGTAEVEYLTPPEMKASPVFSRAARMRSPAMLYTSGLYGDSAGDSPTRVRGILREVDRLTKLAGSSMQQLAKATYYVSAEEESTDLGKIRPEFYRPDSPPAASKAMVSSVGREGQRLCVDMIAAAGKNPPQP